MPAIRISKEKRRNEKIIRQEKLLCDFLSVSEEERQERYDEAVRNAAADLRTEVQQDGAADDFDPEGMGIEASLDYLYAFAEDLSELAVVEDPNLMSELCALLMGDLEKMLPFADPGFKGNFVMLRRLISDSCKRMDSAALSDLLHYELQAVLKAGEFKKRRKSRGGDALGDLIDLDETARAQADMIRDESLRDI